MRDTAYNMQLKARLKVLHKLAGESIESLYKGDLDKHYSNIAYHYEKAETWDKAAEYYKKAGDYYRKNYNNEGEAAKLGFPVKKGDRRSAAHALAKHLHVIVVLKGHNTVIASPDGNVIIDKSGGSELATAGTGDILAGLIGSMLASWAPSNLKECLQVVAKAVGAHGLAGNMHQRIKHRLLQRTF